MHTKTDGSHGHLKGERSQDQDIIEPPWSPYKVTRQVSESHKDHLDRDVDGSEDENLATGIFT